MIVCHCFGLSDRAIREAARRGQPQLAAAGCGGCLPVVEALVQAEFHRGSIAPQGRNLPIVGRATELPFVPAAAVAGPSD